MSASDLADLVPSILDLVRNDGLLVLPTDTVYGIGCTPYSAHAVQGLLAAKGRGEQMPPPILAPSAEVAFSLSDWSQVPAEVSLLAARFWPGPLTMVIPSSRAFGWDLSKHGQTIAVRVPRDDLARRVLLATGPLAVSSANLTGRPASTTVEQAKAYFGAVVGLYLDGGRCQLGAPSTIIDCSGQTVRLVRQGALQWKKIEQALGPNGSQVARDVNG